MNACKLIAEDPNSMLGELAALESAMNMAEGLLGWAKPRHDELMAELDRLTSPPSPLRDSAHIKVVQSVESLAVVPQQSERRYVTRGYDYKGVAYRAKSKIDIFKGLLRMLLDDYPDKHVEILKVLHGIGRDRLYLSRDRWTLFTGKDRAWVEQHSVDLGNGWYVDTNLSGSMIQRLLPVVVRASGMVWGNDVIVRFEGRFTGA